MDAVARDIVHHFLNHGYQAKHMVVTIDKLPARRVGGGEGPRIESAGGKQVNDSASLCLVKPNTVKTEAKMALKNMDNINL